VRLINESKKIVEELLLAKSLISDTKGSSIFQAVDEYFTGKNVPLTNMIACKTDRAPPKTGRHNGFIAQLKKVIPHCYLYYYHRHWPLNRDRLVDRSQIDFAYK